MTMRILRVLPLALLFACTNGNPVGPDYKKVYSTKTVCEYNWQLQKVVCITLKNPLDN